MGGKILKKLFSLLIVAAICAVFDSSFASASEEQGFQTARQSMVEEQVVKRGVRNGSVIESMLSVPRHLFVTEKYVSNAYRDTPLPIDYGQTISQPYIVAYMTEMLKVKGDDTVLEVGTGSGYQAAILSVLVNKVYTIEIIPELALQVARRLKKLNYKNVDVKNDDGYYGWQEHAPFDAIIVTAAAGHIPPPLVRQLKRGGRMIIPVGGPFMVQSLVLVTKGEGGEITTENVMYVRFVPLTGGH